MVLLVVRRRGGGDVVSRSHSLIRTVPVFVSGRPSGGNKVHIEKIYFDDYLL